MLRRVTRPCFDFTKAQALGREMRRGMIERNHPVLSVGAQCRLLSISRSSFYYEPQGETETNLALDRWISFYNHQRPHAAHGGQPPAVVYFNSIETDQQARRVA